MSIPYQARFVEGAAVRIAPLSVLEEFRRTWRLHHPLAAEQLLYADRLARVAEIGFYHGGDALYRLQDIPGEWHEQCLETGEQR